MRRLVTVALLLLLLLAALPIQGSQAQGAPGISVKSAYTVNRYGFATINETVRFTNNGSSAATIPQLTFSFGDLTGNIVSPSGPYVVGNGGSLPAHGNATFTLGLLLNGVVSRAANGSLQVLTLVSPSISQKVDSLLNIVSMPASTTFRSAPAGLKAVSTGTNVTYSSSVPEVTPSASTSLRAVSKSTSQDFNPLRVYYAERTITAAPNGNPMVTDSVKLQNMGTNLMTAFFVNILGPVGTKVTILPSTEPKLENPVTLTVAAGVIDLTAFAVAFPSAGIPAGTNFTLTYQYALGASYYSVGGGEVSLTIPDKPPVSAFIDTYSISLSLPQGVTSSQSAPAVLSNVTPWTNGQTSFSYGLTVGWAVDAGVPGASIVFVLLLIGLFAMRTTPAEAEEEEEEETSTEMASTMISAFDEKTTLINSLWPEIEAKDPNELDKEYFDELRSRLDSFRSRALQRLNEVKQKSTSKRFFEVLNQMQTTEREVDRAAKDKLNLYQQYYLRQMRKEVYDRLLPQYSKRLEKALNQLSDELHNVQREAKAL